MLYPLSYGCQWAELKFCPYKLSNLKFTPLPSLHVDFYSRHDNSFLFFLHNCPLLIPLYNTAVLINICRFLINVVNLCKPLSKLDLPTFRNGSTEEIGARKAEDLGSSPSECHIFHLFRCVISYVLPLRSVGRSNFVRVCINLTTLIQ